MALEIAVFLHPPLRELEQQREDFLKDNRPAEYKRLKKSGQLSREVREVADRATRYAENLISTGTYPGPAWIEARKTVILETPGD